MRTLFTFLLVGFFILQSSAQNLHMPAEVNYILKESKKSYVFDDLKEEVRLNEYVARAIFPEVIIPDSFQFEVASDHKTSVEYEKYRIKAEKFAGKGKYFKAIENYSAALVVVEPGDLWSRAQIFRKISFCYVQLKDYENAQYWLLKGLKTNVTPALFYKELADVYQLLKEKGKALSAITKASLFDPKDETIQASLREYYASNHLEPGEWTFLPQFQIVKSDNDTIRIFSKGTPWRAYAACKALWQNEPEYVRKMEKLSSDDLTMIEEKECLLNALITWEKLENGKELFPAFSTLSDAVSERMIDTYLLYETRLRIQPDLIYILEAHEVEQLVAYLINVRALKQAAAQ